MMPWDEYLEFVGYKPNGVFGVAKRILEEKGWIQGDFCTDRGVCAMRAVTLAAEEVNVDSDIACQTIRNLIGCDSLTGWNDSDGRTKEEVVAVLTKAEAL